jgi:hypothetical protein
MYAFLVVAASWKWLVETSQIPSPPLMIPAVISNLPIQTCIRPETVLPALCTLTVQLSSAEGAF